MNPCQAHDFENNDDMNELDILKAEKALREKREEIQNLKLNLTSQIHEMFIKHGEEYLIKLKEFNNNYESKD
jgi:hypothetical protein